MPGFAVTKQSLIACDQRQALRTGSRSEDAIGRVGVEVTGKPGGFDEDTGREWDQLQAAFRNGGFDKVIH